ncbi:MAG: DUF6288 domain-containing protein [Planctomycetes bacterium]|nr:DUF6288 domain-containing protein [Planctomycetota bacterium]
MDIRVCALAWLALAAPRAAAQVHYSADGDPWKQRASAGPDAEVPGWYYNLGITGLRVELVEAQPTHLVVRYVFTGSPAASRVAVGDHIVGAGGARFEVPHRNGYGMDVFGAKGPLEDFARALEHAQAAGDGKLALALERDGKPREVELALGKRYGAFAASFPADCKKSERILAELLAFLLDAQGDDGSFGDAVNDTFAPLALLASGKREHLAAVERNVRFHARTTSARDEDDLINWRYMTAAIVMSEYHLATGERWVLPELEQVRDFLYSSQYLSLEQLNPKVKESHPDSWPTDARQQHGGWGHNPGFEGYGPIAMLTGQGALAFDLMKRCGLEIDRARHDAAFEFLARGTGSNGYVWYADEVAGDSDWADMGRTGAAGIANQLSPWPEASYRTRARKHALLIGEHPESYPDTHGSPILGMGYAAMAANVDPASFRRLMDANRWWFSLAQCGDGTFYYQPNRDNAGYGEDSRLSASAVTAFVLSIPKHNLAVTGRGAKR